MPATAASEAVLEDVNDEQVERFREDGFLIIEEGFLSDGAIDMLRERFAALFEGDYATGIAPDEVNWKQGRDPDDRTRQLCNGWRSDDVIAAQVLSERTGRIASRLMGYRGVRMIQDNCLWKPPGARSLGMHQDASYAGYLVPAETTPRPPAAPSSTCGGRTAGRGRRQTAAASTPPRTGSRR